MNTELERKIVQNKLSKFMHQFDAENRNNRLSPCMIAGMGGFLENLIIEIVREVEKNKTKQEVVK